MNREQLDVFLDYIQTLVGATTIHWKVISLNTDGATGYIINLGASRLEYAAA